MAIVLAPLLVVVVVCLANYALDWIEGSPVKLNVETCRKCKAEGIAKTDGYDEFRVCPHSAKGEQMDPLNLHWAIRLRKRLLVPRTSKWNGYVRRSTAWLEVHLPG